jgi:radical SAM superfamily enzyme YgiQ (UPF0313 family)
LLISANTEQINVPVLPVGMARVAAAADRAGHDIQVLNLMRPEHLIQALPETVSGFGPEVIGISVRNIDDQCMNAPRFLLPPVQAVVEACRRLSRAPIVLGGAGYSIFPRPVLDYLQADYGIRGEGEAAFPLLLERLGRDLPVSDVAGLVLPSGSSGPPPARIRRLDDYPPPTPGVHLDIPVDVDSTQLWVPFQTRRGCPMKCTYCSSPAIEGRLMRRQSISAVVENLRCFVSAGYRRFFFVDNLFNMPPAYAECLCDAIIDAELDIAWQAIVYPLRIRPRLAEKMARAGCAEVALGFESGHPEVLLRLNKRFLPEDIRQAASVFQKCGISRMGFLLLGGPGETRQSVRRSIEFADSLELESVKLTPGIRIYPETPLAALARGTGMVAPDADLLAPTFYLEPGLEGWLQDEASRIASQRENWYL